MDSPLEGAGFEPSVPRLQVELGASGGARRDDARARPASRHRRKSCRKFDFLRAELDRVGPALADLCRDFFRWAVALELSFFEAAYTDRT